MFLERRPKAEKSKTEAATQERKFSRPLSAHSVPKLCLKMNDSEILLESCRFYIEGVALLPISIIGIIGK